MTYLLIPLILGAAAGLSWPLGRAMTWAMDPAAGCLGIRGRMENLFRWAAGPAITTERTWKGYALSLLFFNGGMFLCVFVLLSLQQVLPFNPDGKGPLSLDLIFHTAASFTSNTNLQHYAGEVSLSTLSQVFGLLWLQFLSAATGIAALTALARGLAGKPLLGNFYRDLLRATCLVLLPLAGIVAVLLLLCGVPMTLEGAVTGRTLEGALQVIPRGPIAAFEAIKQLGTNGGGWFGPNAAHPFENPSFISNGLESLCIVLIPMACVWMFGRITGRMRHAAVLFAVMGVLLTIKIGCAVHFERLPTPALSGLPVQTAGNLEGKELRFGMDAASFWGALTTATSSGSVNGMLDSFNPLTGLVLLGGMWLNVTFGGVGAGMLSMVLYCILGVFLSGMMVGRTPEYLSRKIETREMRYALLALLLHPLLILGGTALFAATPWGASTVHNPGSHGFTEILYEFSSAAANNGSGFEGLNDTTVPWNVATGIIMLLARYLPIVLPLAIAGSLASKKPSPETMGTLRTDTPLFGLVLLGCVLILGALLFMPVAVLGPIAEHLGVGQAPHG